MKGEGKEGKEMKVEREEVVLQNLANVW